MKDLAKKISICNTFNAKIEHAHCTVWEYRPDVKGISSQSHRSDPASAATAVCFLSTCKHSCEFGSLGSPPSPNSFALLILNLSPNPSSDHHFVRNAFLASRVGAVSYVKCTHSTSNIFFLVFMSVFMLFLFV